MAVQTLHLINDDTGPRTLKSRATDVFHLQAFVYPKTGNAGGGTVALALNVTDSRGINGPTTVTAKSEAVPATGSWSMIDGYATVPTGYDTVDPVLTLTSVPVTDYVYVDDALVREETYTQQVMATIFGTTALPASGAAAIPPANIGAALDQTSLLADLQALATTVLGSTTSQQANGNTNILQNIADAMHQVTYGGGATQTPMDLTTLKGMFAAQPSATVVPTPNPNSAGLPLHGASGTGWTAGINSSGTNGLSASGSHTKATNDNFAGIWAIYAVQMLGSNVPTQMPRFASYGGVTLPSITGPIEIWSSGSDFWCLEYFGAIATLPAGAQTVNVNVGTGGGSLSGYVYGVQAVSDTYSGVQSVVYNFGYQNNGGALSMSAPSGANNISLGAFAAVNYLGADTISGLTGLTQRGNYASASSAFLGAGFGLAVGDSVGTAGSQTWTATATHNQWGGGIVNLVGAGTTPIGSGCRVYRTSTGTFNSPSNTTAVLPANTFNTTPDKITADMTWTPSTNGIQVANAGWYMVTLSLLMTGSYSGSYYLGLALYKAGALVQWGERIVLTSGYTYIIQSTWSVYCNAGDTLQPGSYANYPSAIAAFTGEASGLATYFEVTLANRSLL